MILRDQLGRVILGTVFLLIGLVACSITAMRLRRGGRIFLGLGAWSAMYGARFLAETPAVVASLPHWIRIAIPSLNTVITYFLVVVASLAWMELTAGSVRFFLQAVIVVGLAIGFAGLGFFIFTGSTDKLIPYNNLLAACALLVLVTVVTVPRLSRKFLILPNRGVLAFGSLVFSIEALYGNLAGPLHFPRTSPFLDSLAFAVLLFSFGYVALQMTLANERRLLSIENELEIARRLQFSILPTTIPDMQGIRIAAIYQPMTAVAGDFYEFVPVDPRRAGFLIADVSGHGVPAALIAAMIKVAVQSVASCAQDPREVLRGLDRILSRQLRGAFVSAAFLWLDTEAHKASYSAAGHPPLLRWRNGELERIESNGLLFGVRPGSDYPVCEMPLNPGDRFLLYTDGVTEPENAKGDAFGDYRLEQVLRNNPSCAPAELSSRLLGEIAEWRPAGASQQDDITLIVIDVV